MKIFQKRVLLICAAILLFDCCARDAEPQEEPQPEISSVGRAEFVCKLSKPSGLGGGTQGLDIFGDYVVNCRNTGYGLVFRFDGRTVTYLGGFPLGSQNENNHSNVASFGRKFFKEGDPLPVLYVSQAAKTTWNGYKDVLFVERIAPDFKSSELVQIIHYDDSDNDFGYALQWVVDEKGEYLYGYGNTTRDSDTNGNRHRIVKFRLPPLDAHDKEGMVILKPSDALENYTIEDCGCSFATIGQGLYVWKERLYMPTGAGNDKNPARLYVWNLRTRKMDVVEELAYADMGEPEDISRWRDLFIISSSKGLYTISIK